MAIRTVVTRGYGNGTFNGTVPLVVTRGYTIGAAVVFTAQIYTADVYANPTPTEEIYINPTPSIEVRSG